ncbi:NAD(P)/FAD-dependent oxidoreductase [Lichenifustis flavocetrariae]|uniref:NAD(P)/FAD-dependent oxidoreductase n=1 Tax=Lichenifustis flavocetrariae TaxID=2949735 RepID=A0AA41YY18_9HYPH|nr:NAD(P)/FAD-dependent oxidoreductase [Lichenifustis flavocetrariae]MCW6509307.1 NAD(P)/FAD-dependent oxidoreductase [Lichenifustis flavocetrariae]
MNAVALAPQRLSAADERVLAWLDRFEKALSKQDTAGAASCFAATCFWRDLIALTWNITTLEGRDAISGMLEAQLGAVRPRNFALDEAATEADGVTEAWITFETEHASGLGYLRLKGEEAWTLLTTARELKGFEEPRGPRREKGVQHGAAPSRRSWLEQRQDEEAAFGRSRQPYCLIVGGGQGGLALGARLKRLGVPTLIVDKHARPGDQWRSRYKSLHLHDPVWYDHLPYLPFPDHWPVFAAKDKIGDWLEMYCKVMELNYWAKTECRSARYDADKKEWTVEVNHDGETVTLHPKQLVLATGMSGVPNLPNYPGMADFKGESHHSSQHPGGERFKGKTAVVIGSNNSAHDICADFYENGADVTMVQRTSTHIARSESLMELALGGLYSEEAVAKGITTDKADLIFASVPYRIMHEFHVPVYAEMKKRDADFYARLEKAGFKLDFGDDESGLFMKYLRRGSGYYIDVGASELIADGKIKLKHGQVERVTETGVRLADGTELPADVIVYATGYGSMNGWAAKLISQQVADAVGKCWGLGSDTTKDPGPWEGELRNMWKPTRQEGLWFHGGNLHQSRHYSLYLALQIKARLEGIPTPVYGLAETHHKG